MGTIVSWMHSLGCRYTSESMSATVPLVPMLVFLKVLGSGGLGDALASS